MTLVLCADRATSIDLMTEGFRLCHEHLIDAIQAGRTRDAYDYVRLLAYLGPRL